MNTTRLKTYAPKARRDFIAAVTRRAAKFGLSDQGASPVCEEGQVVIIEGQPYPKPIAAQRDKLAKRIAQHGFALVMEATAYTWFNRFAAIRFMELHGYLDHGFRVLSHPGGSALPEILEHAHHLDLPGLDSARVLELKLDGTRDEELYRDLLLAQCRALHQAMPFLFESVDDETELLLPEHLLQTDSLIRELVTAIPEDDWREIEIIGWLYQFYISEKKDQVIGKVVKSEDIPAATQLFTPNWIVKYMVQNALGAQWLATYPDSPLKDQMAYYIEPAEQTDEVKVQLAAITPDSLNPEELTLIDPACGSGHILVEAYELFKAIYLERGYRQRDVARLILEKNLFGLDIDGRAAQLTGFALMMKGRADDRRLLERGVRLNVMALVDSAEFDAEELAKGVELTDYGLKPGSLTELKRLFEHATTFGSLIQMPKGLAKKLPGLKNLSETTNQDLFVSDSIKYLAPLVRQAEILTAQYDAVVANPPYMGAKWFDPKLKAWITDAYCSSEKDLFSAFIVRIQALTRDAGNSAVMTSFVWMFIASFERLRRKIITHHTIGSLVHLHYDAFADAKAHVCTFVVQKLHIFGYRSAFIRLADFPGVDVQGPKTLEAIKNRNCDWYFEAVPDKFSRIPGSPAAYWVSDAALAVFDAGISFNSVAEPKSGLSTTDNDRFLRYWQEVDYNRIGFGLNDASETESIDAIWFPLAKGGAFRRWYGNAEFLVNWGENGREIRAKTKGAPGGRIVSQEFYFKEGVTWSGISSALPSMRAIENSIFGSGAKAVFPARDAAPYLALLNTILVTELLKALSPTVNFEAGHIGNLPIIDIGGQEARVSSLARRLVAASRIDWNAYERSWNFQSIPLLGFRGQVLGTREDKSSPLIPNLSSLSQSYTAWITQNRQTIAEMKRLEEENNRLFIDAYGLADELSPNVPIEQITLTVNPAYRYGKKLADDDWSVEHGFGEELETRFREDTMQELVSYAIGCIMGRYSLDEPGLIYAHAGNIGFEPGRYTTFPADADGIVPITDEHWFADDACSRIREFLRAVWGPDTLEENLAWLAESLGAKATETPDGTIRRYLADSFFKDHLQTYKKRPIYWLLSSGKLGACQALVYLHRYHEGTLARLRMEYVVPLQAKMAARLDRLDDDIASAISSAQAKRLQKERDRLAKQVDELRRYDGQLRHYADQRIALDLDDGVKVNYGKFGNLLADVKTVTGQKSD
jgi:SAM-dependent methyltransferase